jgi:hypothetical protein
VAVREAVHAIDKAHHCVIQRDGVPFLAHLLGQRTEFELEPERGQGILFAQGGLEGLEPGAVGRLHARLGFDPLAGAPGVLGFLQCHPQLVGALDGVGPLGNLRLAPGPVAGDERRDHQSRQSHRDARGNGLPCRTSIGATHLPHVGTSLRNARPPRGADPGQTDTAVQGLTSLSCA